MSETSDVQVERLDRTPHVRRFSASVCSEPDWKAHVAAILAFARKASAVIEDARKLEVTIEFDTAVYAQELERHSYVSCSLFPAELKELGALGVGLTVTLYESFSDCETAGPTP